MPKRPRSKHLFAAAKRRRLAEGGGPEEGRGAAAADSGWADAVEEYAPSHFGQIIDQGLATFEEYYRHHKLVKSPEEWAKLTHSLRQPLPVAFRLTGGAGHAAASADAGKAAETRRELEALLKELEHGCTTARGRRVPPPRRFAFADSVSLECDDKTLRNEQREAPWSALARLATLLPRATARGVASRQEVVSAVPVAALDVQRGHRVLDMCAAPGSKTLQALEQACGGDALGAEADAAAAGAVVANEISSHRGHVLARRCSVVGTSCAGFAVVQHRAQTFPGPTCLFDRIVCDVPCSGDGALRKLPEKWRGWTPHVGRQLHNLQLQIALRAAALLRVGGLLCYSTCSFNPLENEAVVAALLRSTGGAVELVDSPNLEGLTVRPGLRTWKVVDETLGPLASHAEAMRTVPKAERRRYRRSMWPPAADEGELHLERCMRLMPFLQNTGGFFVAVLRKTSTWPPQPSPRGELCGKAEEARGGDDAGGVAGAAGGASGQQLPACDAGMLEALRRDLGSLPSAWPAQLYARGKRRIFLCSPPLSGLLRAAPRRKQLNVVSAGVCVAERGRLTDGGAAADPDGLGPWRATRAGAALLAAEAGRATEANAAAARKVCEGHHCSACGRERPGSCFSRKMLTRPPAKRKCADCVTPPK